MLKMNFDETKKAIYINNRLYPFKKGKRKDVIHLILNDFPKMTEQEFDSVCYFFLECEHLSV